jgi:hypothetical protein
MGFALTVRRVAAGVVLGAAASAISPAALAQSGSEGEKEYKAENAPKKVEGTHETRKAERQQKRKEMAAENKAGEIKPIGEAGSEPAETKQAKTTHAQRKAERKEKQRELAAENKAGKLPTRGESYPAPAGGGSKQ